jgi:threonine/homoserine/homoserine lactone efflux protein
MTLVIFILYGIAASGIRAYLTTSSNVMKRAQQAFAVIFAGLAVKLALSEK